MTPIELMADNFMRLCGMLEWTLGDFTEDELMVRPVPMANHPMWQLGHLAYETGVFASLVPGVKVPASVTDLKAKFSKETQKVDDAKAFPSKAEVLKQLGIARDALAEAVRKLTPEDLNTETPGPFKQFAPTIGHLIEMCGAHVMMHVGQIQVARRKLGKPVLF